MMLIYAFFCSLFYCYDAKDYSKLLSHPEYEIREFATWQLDKTGYESVTVLLELVNDSDPEVRMRVVPIFNKKYWEFNREVVKKIQESPNLEAFLFYFEAGNVTVSTTFASRVVENPELARCILYWGNVFGVLDSKELFYFDPEYIEKNRINPQSAAYYANGGLYIIRCRAIGQPDANDRMRDKYKDKKPLFNKGNPSQFPLIDMHR